MRQIINLKSQIKDESFFIKQFEKNGEKNILFVNPMLSGKGLYKSLLPYLKLNQYSNIATSITSLNEFDMNEQLVGYKAIGIIRDPDSAEMINWATHIVFPFVLQPLHDIYAHIREVNPDCKILYNIDFNFYELPEKHPLHSMFDEDIVIPIVEDNMYFSDTILVGNGMFQSYLINKLTELVQTKYIGVNRWSSYDEIKINMLQHLIDEQIVFDNVDYNPKDIIFKVPQPIIEVVSPPEKIIAPERKSKEKIIKFAPNSTEFTPTEKAKTKTVKVNKVIKKAKGNKK